MTQQVAEPKSIKDNPYQGRQVYEDIEELGRTIATDGLQEMPKARACKGGFELKFGHRRREAFKWLQANYIKEKLPNRYNEYTLMPIDVEILSDEDMYRGAVIENEQRKDLSPIEKAQMMLVYRDQFKKSSEQIGELYGMNGATVRGLIRLLDLPESVQDKVASGDISQGAARSLLTIARVDEKQVKKAADSIAAGASADDVIVQSMRDSDTTITMWMSWNNDGKPRGGEGLWPLEIKPEKFPMKQLPELRAADVAKALGLEFTANLREKIDGYLLSQDGHPVYVAHQLDASIEVEKHPEDADLIERIAHLAKPPACAACPFHASADRSHYCGFKACHQRKRVAWVADEMQKISVKLSIAVYNPVTDGKAFIPLEEHSEKSTKLIKEKDADLRLGPHKQEYRAHKWTDSNFVRVILVGKKATVIKKEKREDGSSQQAKEEAYRKQRELESELREAAKRFCGDYAVRLFAIAFKNFDHIPAMCALTNSGTPKKDAKKPQLLADLRVKLADEALDHIRGFDWDLIRKGPIPTAKFLQGVATSWGVKLPPDFMEVAKGYQPVSTETPEVKKTKKK